MRLSEFLKTHSEQILRAWDEFAATVSHSGKDLDQKALRDDAGQILQAIAKDLEQPQTDAQQLAKSRGEGERIDAGDTAAEIHADTRIVAGFAIDAMITEYRAMRASVLRLWAEASDNASHKDDLRELTRFNEAIDQAISESVARYTEQTKRSTDLFIGILGHDIRNPLGTIYMQAEVLVRTGQLSAKAAEPIVNSAKRINSVIELVVDFSRAQTDGVMPVARSPGNLAEQFSKVVEETLVRHPDAHLRLEADGNFEGNWDEGRMGQLLSNLLGNAVAYGARGQPITIRMAGTADAVTFSVHNFGQPVSAEDRERIFEPMARGEVVEGEKRNPDGLGLGLFICREIVRAHKGQLWLKSEAVAGTSFFVTLPRQ